VTVRFASPGDGPAAAALHVSQIEAGFLASLGVGFLTRLYRRIAREERSLLLVAEDNGQVVGFAAASLDVTALYRSFLLRDGAVAAVLAAPRLARSWRKALETFRYPGHASSALPKAELLSVAVAPSSRGRGYGRALVAEVTAELRRRGSDGVRVVVAADNHAARALYLSCGFEPVACFEMHAGSTSEVLTCS